MNSREGMIGFCRDSLGLPESVGIEFFPLQGRGSERTFIRLKWNRKGSAILVRCSNCSLTKNCSADSVEQFESLEKYGPEGIRTLDLYSAIVALSQLSYRPRYFQPAF